MKFAMRRGNAIRLFSNDTHGSNHTTIDGLNYASANGP
jgi:hypothetical protein